MSETLTILRPDDWHLHLRDGEALAATVPATAAVFGRAIVMPNLRPPIIRVDEALAYRGRILEAVPSGRGFNPLMTLYLTDTTPSDEIRKAATTDSVVACKLYPSGATTNSEHGVTAIERIFGVLELMEELGLPLLVHGEETAPEIDVFDREKAFIDRVLQPLTERFARLKVVFEHITTREAAEFVEGAGEFIAATITPQHLLMNRNDLFTGGLRPHNYCLPVLKRRDHQEALQRVATSGQTSFFLGTDSAPHTRGAKEQDCGCAGCYSAPAALQLYAQFFDQAGALAHLEGFASFHGADYYGLPRNAETITLKRESWTVPQQLEFFKGEAIVPYWAGRDLDWSLSS